MIIYQLKYKIQRDVRWWIGQSKRNCSFNCTTISSSDYILYLNIYILHMSCVNRDMHRVTLYVSKVHAILTRIYSTCSINKLPVNLKFILYR